MGVEDFKSQVAILDVIGSDLGLVTERTLLVVLSNGGSDLLDTGHRERWRALDWN